MERDNLFSTERNKNMANFKENDGTVYTPDQWVEKRSINRKKLGCREDKL